MHDSEVNIEPDRQILTLPLSVCCASHADNICQQDIMQQQQNSQVLVDYATTSCLGSGNTVDLPGLAFSAEEGAGVPAGADTPDPFPS